MKIQTSVVKSHLKLKDLNVMQHLKRFHAKLKILIKSEEPSCYAYGILPFITGS